MVWTYLVSLEYSLSWSYRITASITSFNFFWRFLSSEEITAPWPSVKDKYFKIDVWDQINMNLDVFATVFIENLNNK